MRRGTCGAPTSGIGPASLYFRNADAASHPDFGPRYARYWAEVEQQMRRLGATPDAPRRFRRKKVNPGDVGRAAPLRAVGRDARPLATDSRSTLRRMRPSSGLTIDEYYDQVRSEG